MNTRNMKEIMDSIETIQKMAEEAEYEADKVIVKRLVKVKKDTELSIKKIAEKKLEIDNISNIDKVKEKVKKDANTE